MTTKEQVVIKVSLGKFLDLQVFRRSPDYQSKTPEQITARLTEILGLEIVKQMHDIQVSGQAVTFDVKEALDHTDEELGRLGYEGLKMLGFTSEQARNCIAARMSEATLNSFRRMNQTPQGKLWIQKRASDWLKEGVLPPWEGRL